MTKYRFDILYKMLQLSNSTPQKFFIVIALFVLQVTPLKVSWFNPSGHGTPKRRQ